MFMTEDLRGATKLLFDWPHDSLLVQGSESSEDEREGQIRVGRDYQAVPPPFIPKIERRPDQCPERALLVWSPSLNISNQKCKWYIYHVNINKTKSLLDAIIKCVQCFQCVHSIYLFYNLGFRVTKWNVFMYSIHSIDIQYVDNKYVLHHVLQLALRVPKWNVFDWLTNCC